ncbi:MAG: HD domain-containing protein [Deltaproteobacteria bacterium]|nr:MAG: HD domain-containing protein [Deltaproteobacteria bacterium]
MIDDPTRLPELAPYGAGQRVVRLPELDNVPLTDAVVSVIDHPHFQRLRRVRQLGPTWLVYPGAVHTRFEHAIGVYGTATRYLRSLLQIERVRHGLDAVDVRTVLAAALLHDVGHYPFAHTLEAIHHGGDDAPRHEDLAEEVVFGRAPGLATGHAPIARILERELEVDPHRVCGLIRKKRSQLSTTDRFLQSVFSSAIDADKMDYLWRDSVHLGVPYGRNYDRDRLLNALTLDEAGESIAVTDKGVVSAEIFLFCRYTMFSEVYWHHTVRSVSAMLEAALGDLIAREKPDPADLTSRLMGVGDDELLRTFAAEAAPKSAGERLLHGLTGDRRRLYKRLATWSKGDVDERARAQWQALYALDRRGVKRLIARLSKRLGGNHPLPPGALLLDVPPRDKDRIPDIGVHHPRAHEGAGAWTHLAGSSSIVHGIAHDFVAVVKKIRLFVHPEHAHLVTQPTRVALAVDEALAELA